MKHVIFAYIFLVSPIHGFHHARMGFLRIRDFAKLIRVKSKASAVWFEVGDADESLLREYHAGASDDGKLSFTSVLEVPEIVSMLER